MQTKGVKNHDQNNYPSQCTDSGMHKRCVVRTPRKIPRYCFKLDSLAFDDDPYEYCDNEGVESISDIADSLQNPAYRRAVIEALQDKREYYAEDETDDAHIAERAKDILDDLSEIFGSDEQAA